MLLTGHKSRAIFDRYNIINEQELLDAGDQLVEYLAQQAQAAWPAQPRALPRPSALCDAAPRKGARHINHPHVPYGKVKRAAAHEPKAYLFRVGRHLVRAAHHRELINYTPWTTDC